MQEIKSPTMAFHLYHGSFAIAFVSTFRLDNLLNIHISQAKLQHFLCIITIDLVDLAK